MRDWESAFIANASFAPFNSAKLALFALGLRFDVDDLGDLESSAIIDGTDDKKIDAIYFSEDENVAVIIQAYSKDSTLNKVNPPSNKAADLNAAAAWAFNMPIESVPERIRPAIQDLRSQMSSGAVERIEFWYLHNQLQSVECDRELSAVETTARASILAMFAGKNIEVSSIQIGDQLLQDWYESLFTPILVNEDFKLENIEGFEISQPDWAAFASYVKASWFQTVYKKFTKKLFSANIRDYLGSRHSDMNINNGIKETCISEPQNFWVYNNGVTCLVNDFKFEKESKKLSLSGLAIVNGAQTTGAVGTLENCLDGNAFIPVRFVKCSKPETVKNIIKYNNSQNKLSAADFRSTDRIQKRLVTEFGQLGGLSYSGRRGGADAFIPRPQNSIPRDTVAKSIVAFHGEPVTAYQEKKLIWEDDKIYSRFFNDSLNARHILFVYSLLRSIEIKKKELLSKGDSRTQSENDQLTILRHRGAIPLFMSAVSDCLEVVLGQPIHSKFDLKFSKSDIEKLIKIWGPLINIMSPFLTSLEPALTGGLRNQAKASETRKILKQQFESTKSYHTQAFSVFKSELELV